MSTEDERFAHRLRAAWPAPAPSAGFDAALERRLQPRRRPVWGFALAGVAAAALALVALRPERQPLEVMVPEVAVDDGDLYAALELAADEEEWLPDDYVDLAEVLDL